MTSLLRRRLGVAGALGVLAATWPQAASAAPDCSSLPSPVYAQGGNSPKPFIKNLATALTNASPATSIVFQTPGACLGIDAIVTTGTKMTGTASFWDSTGKETTCNLSVAGDTVQIGIGNNYPTLCPEITSVPSDFGDYLGPVQAFDFIVPTASSQTNISAAAAYFVFGFGASNAQAAPWATDSLIFGRNATSAVELLIAKAINVPLDKMKNVDGGSSTGVITDVGNSADPEHTLGLVADEVAQASASTVRPLAYQHYGQDCGYWPSSTHVKLDKQNVRDGHYYIWGYTHFYAHKGSDGKPVDPDAKKVIGYVTGDVAPPSNLDIVVAAGTAGAVPICAMEVKRTSDLGDIEMYADPAPCGCAFDAAATGTTSCQSCAHDSDCPASATHCRHAYCEVN